MNSFASVLGRNRNVITVVGSHFLHLHEGANLIGDFFTLTNDFVGHHAASAMGHVFFLFGNQKVDTVKGDTTVVTDNTATAIGVRQTRNDLVFAGKTHFRRIGIVHTLVMSLMVFRENLVELRIGLIAVGFTSLFGHLDAAKRHKSTL